VHGLRTSAPNFVIQETDGLTHYQPPSHRT
jgi:hypothetical protein